MIKKGLGKGLNALLSIYDEEEEQDENVSRETKPASNGIEGIDISLIYANPNQPRKTFDETALKELATSIKTHGIIQPIVLNRAEDGKYMIIAGERRWRAAKMAGLEQVPAFVRNYTPKQIKEISIIENLQREDLNPIEEALAYKRLLSEFNLKQDEVAERVSKSRTAVTNAMRLLKLNDKVQQMVIEEMLTTGHARALLGIEDQEKQYTIAQKIFDEKLSVRDTEKLVKSLQNEKKKQTDVRIKLDPKLEAIYHDLEEQMKVILGTKVSINHKDDKKGKLEIEYYSQDELDRIIDLLRTIQK